MPNYISKVALTDGTYDIKDTQARADIASKQDTLISGTNIKTINNQSLLGSGNITIGGGSGGGDGTVIQTITDNGGLYPVLFKYTPYPDSQSEEQNPVKCTLGVFVEPGNNDIYAHGFVSSEERDRGSDFAWTTDGSYVQITDMNVSQSRSTANSDLPIIVKTTTATTAVTGPVNFENTVTVNPSTGKVKAAGIIASSSPSATSVWNTNGGVVSLGGTGLAVENNALSVDTRVVGSVRYNGIQGIPSHYRYVYAEYGDNGQLSLDKPVEDGYEVHIIIRNTNSAATISINLPSSTPYSLISYDTIYIGPTKCGEVSIICINGTNYVRGVDSI